MVGININSSISPEKKNVSYRPLFLIKLIQYLILCKLNEDYLVLCLYILVHYRMSFLPFVKVEKLSRRGSPSLKVPLVFLFSYFSSFFLLPLISFVFKFGSFFKEN